MSINNLNDATDRPSPSFTCTPASTSAAAAPAPITNPNNHDAPSNINPAAANTSDVDSVPTCPHCNRTLKSGIGLVGHLRIHRTETGELVHGAPTCNRCARLHYPLFPHVHTLYGPALSHVHP
ncbi:unnamed protein product [Schistocephalus solidus]|uniref:C2H2-type domain-containing protein n=1 Tax=Schistocephalus solidus TaxID=70667 RepID=A0A183TLT8_SCHSO|nr:unnamed protein product [Schistocephalus solidus]